MYEELALAAILKLMDEQTTLPRNKADYVNLLNTVKGQWLDSANKIAAILFEALSCHQKIAKHLHGSITPAWMIALGDVKEQTHHLLGKHFLTATPFTWLQYYPRYLQAVVMRLDKLSGQFLF